MNEQEQKIFINYVLTILEEYQKDFADKKAEALEKSLAYKEEYEKYLIQEKTVQSIKAKFKLELDKLKEKGE